MSRRRFFVPSEQIRQGVALLSPDQAHHLRNVLRLRDGDTVEIFDGTGKQFEGKVALFASEVRVGHIQEISASSRTPIRLALAVALIKPDRFEWILQKGTELGVNRFIPLTAHFTNVRLKSDKILERMERWRRIICEAAKQCGRQTLPELDAPCTVQTLAASAEFACGSRFMLHEREGERLQWSAEFSDPVLLCIGPEGGWHADETEAARGAGFRLVNLGSRILRAETAALAGTTLFQFLIENRAPETESGV
jgi:16S rRNA (uracil1498-N3)-methyltransferase